MPIDPGMQPDKVQQSQQNIQQQQAAQKVQKLSKEAQSKSVAQQLAQGENEASVTTHAIKSFMATAASKGIDLDHKRFQKKAEESMIKELAQAEKGENKQEKVTLSNYAAYMQKKTKGTRAHDFGRGRYAAEFKGERSNLSKQYLIAYTKYASEYSPELQSELKELESKMRKKGFTPRELSQMRVKMKNAMRQEILTQLKESMVSRELSASDLWTSARYTRMMYVIMDQARGMHKLGGKDFGGYKGHLTRGILESMGDARGELSTFIGDELKESITSGVLKGNEEYLAKFDELQKLATRVQFNFDKFIGDIDKFMDDEGLSSIKLPKKKSILDEDEGESDEKGDGQGEQEGQSSEEEKEMLLDMLRAALLEKALKGGFRTKIKTMFKMRSVKKGLMRLGVYTPEIIERVKREASAIAGMKIMEMLREAILERSTLYNLKSAEYKLVRRKIQGLIKNAKALGIEIGEEAIRGLIAQANRKTFDLIKGEISLIDAELEQKSNNRLKDRREKLVEVMKRIKGETNIPDEIPEVPYGDYEIAEKA